MRSGILFAVSLVISTVVTLILEKKFIPFLMRIKMGQVILEIGPRWHKSKEGTPTMGGIFFISAITVITLAFVLPESVLSGNYSVIITFVMMILFGVIGFVDDYTKFVKKRNLGLTAIQKLILQFAVAAIYVFVMKGFGYITTDVALPFTDTVLHLGNFYYAVSIIFIAFTVNSTNLTDGIDGLCGSVTAVVAVMFGVIAFLISNRPMIALCGGIIGGLIGFLYYNINPARIFMGDTGSLFIGGTVVGLAYIINCPLIIFIAGLWYFIESISVMMQVFSFQVFHKRIFKMTPIHHHFELCKWSEHKIVRVFSVFTAILSVVALFGYYL